VTKLTVIILAAAGALLAAASFAETYSEVTPYLAGAISPASRFAAITSGDLVPADSHWSKDLYIKDCLEVPRSIYGLAQPVARRRLLLVTCRNAAQEILTTAPTMSGAWLVLASTSAELGDFGTMRSALARSKKTAPKLQWLADRRSALVERHADEADAATRAGYADDIAVLAAGRAGIEVLAYRYARRAQDRDFYAGIVEAAAPGQQRLFLDRAKVYLSGAGR